VESRLRVHGAGELIEPLRRRLLEPVPIVA